MKIMHIIDLIIVKPTLKPEASLGWSLLCTLAQAPAQAQAQAQKVSKLILYWLYLSFHWSECDQNFREDPSKVHDHIQIKIKMSNPSQEPPASSKAQNQDLKDMDVLCIFKSR